jgi:hypothetical protein
MRHLDFMSKRLALLDLLRDRRFPGSVGANICAPFSAKWPHRPAQPYRSFDLDDFARTEIDSPNWILRWKPHIEPTRLEQKAEDSSSRWKSSAKSQPIWLIATSSFTPILPNSASSGWGAQLGITRTRGWGQDAYPPMGKHRQVTIHILSSQSA